MKMIHILTILIGAVFFIWFSIPLFTHRILNIGNLTGLVVSGILLLGGIFYKNFQQGIFYLQKNFLGKCVNIARVTLHVGLGTFRPVKEANVLEHHMHSEYYNVTETAAKLINDTKKNGGRIIAVGTTSTRTLESVADDNGVIHPGCGNTEIFIYPGYKFKAIDCLITNFHLPESTLLMLVSALAGKDHIMAAYEEAVKERYRFFSFGDAMFIC